MFVKSDLIHDGVMYKKGDQVKFASDLTAKLVADGVLTSKHVLSQEEEDAEEVVEDDTEEEEVAETVTPAVPTPPVPPVEPTVVTYVVTEQNLLDNPALAEQGLEAGDKVWLKPEALARVGEPGFLASILKKTEEEDPSANL